MKKPFYLIILLFSFQHFSFSQDQGLADSLKAIVKTTKQDTTKAKYLIQISEIFSGTNPDKAMEYARQALILSEKAGFRKGILNAVNRMGLILVSKGEYVPAMEHIENALKLGKEMDNKPIVGSAYNSIGTIYFLQGNYPEALKNFFLTLSVAEKLGNKSAIANIYNNIGSIYFRQENYSEALKIFFLSLKIAKETKDGDKRGLAGVYNNIGAIYFLQGKESLALLNYIESLKVAEKIGDKKGISNAYSNIGSIYKSQNNYDEGLKNYFACLKISEEISDKDGIANAFINIGGSYSAQRKYQEASHYLKKALSLSKEIGSLDNLKNCYKDLATLDSFQGNYKQAWEHYMMSVTARDSMLNIKNATESVQTQLRYEFDKKVTADKAEQEKKDVIAKKELTEQKLIRNGFVGGFVVVMLFAGVFFMQRNRIRKGKQRSDELLLNILPAEVAEELKEKGNAEARQIDSVTVLFTDFKGFTRLTEKLTPKELVTEINACFSFFDLIMQKHGVEKIKTIGDSYMAAGGLPTPNNTHARDVICAALDIQQYMKEHKRTKEEKGELFFEIRIGVHTGPVVAGIVGIKKFAYDIWGDTVNTASRMESSGEAGKVNISGSTYDLVKEHFICHHRGKIDAKNKGLVDMYFVDRIN